MIGSFDSNSGCPIITIDVSGAYDQPFPISGIVDTGFSGFISIPLVQAFPIGLVLRGTINLTLADGSTQARLMCLGMAHFEGEEQLDLITIETTGDQVLIGMQFLNRFQLELRVNPSNQVVELVKAENQNAPPTQPDAA